MVEKTFAGHAFAPLQVSAGSHTPVDARHSVPVAILASAGQVAVPPAQVSAASQLPAAARQVAPADMKMSAGQLTELPEQVSARSQLLAAAERQVKPEGRKTSAGHGAVVPLQVSATSQPPAAAARHSVFAATAGYEHTMLGEPLQVLVVHALLSSQPVAALQPQLELSGYVQAVEPPRSSMLSMRQLRTAPPPVAVRRS